MAIGDDAVAAGMSIVDGATTDANTIDTEINRSRDYIAQRERRLRAAERAVTGPAVEAAE